MALNATLDDTFHARMLDVFHHPLYVIDVRDYSIVYANAATRIHGNVQSGVTTCYALTHARDTPCDGQHPCPLQSVLETARPAVTEHVHFDADKQPFPVEVHGEPMFDEAGELRYMMEYSLDISDRRDLEQKLRRAAMVIDQSAEGILITDPDQTIIEVNPSFTTITGYPAEEVIGRTPRILRSGEQGDAFYATLWDTLNRDGYWKGEIWNRYRREHQELCRHLPRNQRAEAERERTPVSGTARPADRHLESPRPVRLHRRGPRRLQPPQHALRPVDARHRPFQGDQ
jgi:PAS domain S-box-containing protein